MYSHQPRVSLFENAFRERAVKQCLRCAIESIGYPSETFARERSRHTGLSRLSNFTFSAPPIERSLGREWSAREAFSKVMNVVCVTRVHSKRPEIYGLLTWKFVSVRREQNAQARLVVDGAARVVRLALLQTVGQHESAGNGVEHHIGRGEHITAEKACMQVISGILIKSKRCRHKFLPGNHLEADIIQITVFVRRRFLARVALARLLLLLGDFC